MDDSLLVGRFKGFDDLDEEGKGFIDREGAGFQSVMKSVALDQLQYQESDSLGLLDVVERRDVWVV